MSEEQKPQLSEAECTPRGNSEIEDEELWLYKDGDTNKQEDNSLNHSKPFLHRQDILQEKKGSTEDDESRDSDSDTDDNVKVIIGNIKTNPSMYMEMLTNVNSQADENMEATTSDNAIIPSTD